MLRVLGMLTVALGLCATASAADVDKYLLDDTDAVIGLEIKVLLKAPLVQKNYVPLARKQIQGNAEVQKQLTELGFDPFRDLDRVLIVHGESCHRGSKGSKDEVSPLVIARGKFDATKIHTKFTQLAQFVPTVFKVHKEKNGVVYEVAGGDKTFYLAMPDRGTIVGSMYKDHISDALDKGLGKKTTKLQNGSLKFLISQVDYNHSVWVAALGHAAFNEDNPLPTVKDKKVAKNARKKLSDSGIDEISGGITVSDGLKADFRVIVPDEDTAKQISEVVQTFLPQLIDGIVGDRKQDKKMAPVQEFLKSMTVGRDVRDLIIRGDVSGKVFVESLK